MLQTIGGSLEPVHGVEASSLLGLFWHLVPRGVDSVASVLEGTPCPFPAPWHPPRQKSRVSGAAAWYSLNQTTRDPLSSDSQAILTWAHDGTRMRISRLVYIRQARTDVEDQMRQLRVRFQLKGVRLAPASGLGHFWLCIQYESLASSNRAPAASLTRLH